jgi:hypoxanthine phosphoribosyltransferase
MIAVATNIKNRPISKISWEFCWNAAETLADDISKIEPDATTIIGIMRGGIIFSAMLQYYLGFCDVKSFDVDDHNLVISTYGDGYHGGLVSDEFYGRNILLVDDISDTGTTLNRASAILSRYCTTIKTCTIFINNNTKKFPDYYFGKTNDWILYPWEK